MSIPPSPLNPNSMRKPTERGEGSSQATAVEVDDQGSLHASPAVSHHTEKAEGSMHHGKRPRLEEESEEDCEAEGLKPLFPKAFLTLTEPGRIFMVKDLMSRFSSTEDFNVVRKDPSKFISSAFDGILKAGVTMSVLAEEYKRCAVQDMEGLQTEARVQINDLKLELSSAKDALEKAKQDLTDAQEDGRTRILTLETKVAEANEENKKMIELLKKKIDELTTMKKELTKARAKGEQSQEEVIADWKRSPAFADFQSELGYEAFEAGIADALGHMETAFAAFGLQESYPKVRDKVRDLLAAADAEVRRMVLAEQNQQGETD